MKKGIALITALVLSVLLLGCEEAVTYATADDAKAALNGQGVITIDGDFSEPNQASDIRASSAFTDSISASHLSEIPSAFSFSSA